MVDFNSPPEAVSLNDRLLNDLMFLHKYTMDEEKETGAFVVRGLHGGLGLVSQLLGEGREVTFAPHEQIHEGEFYLGLSHMHPVSDMPSVHDIATFLADSTERISFVVGDKGTINLTVKTRQTEKIQPDQVEEMKGAYEQDDVAEIADAHKFLYYRGKGDTLSLQNHGHDGEMKGKVALDVYVKDVEGERQIPTATVKKSHVINRVQTSAMGMLDSRRFADMYSLKASKTGMTYEEESEIIRENMKKPENKKPHKFVPARWTHGNGHPRCLRCRDEPMSPRSNEEPDERGYGMCRPSGQGSWNQEMAVQT